jgi:cytochrome P450
VEAFFRQRTILQFTEAIGQIAAQLVAQLVAAGEGDLVTSFCRQLPTRSIALLLGLPADKHEDFVNESLRWESPVLFFIRRARESVTLSQTRIPAGATVAACIGSAKRDEAYFAMPDSFQLDRPQKQIAIAFGVGPHVCLGIHLARLEMRVGLEALLDGTNTLCFHEEQRDPHIHGLVFRSPETIRVRVSE